MTGGKYSEEGQVALKAAEAQAALLIVLGGKRGDGFTLSVQKHVREQVLSNLPTVLRMVAAEMESEAKLARVLEPSGMRFPEQFRWCHTGSEYENKAGDRFGAFLIPADKANGRPLKIIAADGMDTGWEHVSVSILKDMRCPGWKEMCLVKDLFWDEAECVVQFHVPKEDHVNLYPGCLHLWKSVREPFPRPPRIAV